MRSNRRLWLHAGVASLLAPTLDHGATAASHNTPSPSAAPTPAAASAALSASDTSQASALEARVREQIGVIRSDLAATATPLLTPITVKVEFQPFIIGITTTDRGKTFDISLPTWAQLSPEYRQTFDRWVRLAGTGMDAPAFFADTFNWALVVHEVGHAISAERFRTFSALGAFREEELANRLMVAWCHAQPGQRERLDRIGRTWEALYEKLPSPLPAGAQPRAWFEREYDKLTENPDAYGWFQYRWMAQAWQDRHTLTLAEAAAELTRKPT